MSNNARIETGDSWMGGKYADLTVNGKTYTGRGNTESAAVEAAKAAQQADSSTKKN
jgi:hypothetical protein